MAYFYILTPSGVEQKARITVDFLEAKMLEFGTLKQEIEELIEETKRFES